MEKSNVQIGFELDDLISTPIKRLTDLEDIPKQTVIEGAVEVLTKIKEAGHQIVIYTNRDASTMLETQRWLDKNKIPHHHVYFNRPKMFRIFAKDCQEFINWEETKKHLEKYDIVKKEKTLEDVNKGTVNNGVQDLRKPNG